LTSSRTASTKDEELRSSLMIEGGFARVNPVPTTSKPCLWNAFTTCLPSRPVAPVTRAVFVMFVVVKVGDSRSRMQISSFEPLMTRDLDALITYPHRFPRHITNLCWSITESFPFSCLLHSQRWKYRRSRFLLRGSLEDRSQ
jgi:hypothetical protein